DIYGLDRARYENSYRGVRAHCRGKRRGAELARSTLICCRGGMKQVLSILVGMALASSVAVGQQPDSLRYHEPTNDGNYRFYFDDRYYLADRACECVSIERDGKIGRAHV